MPRNYSRKTDRQGWDKTSMEKAIEAVNNNEMGWLLASKVFNVPQSTLRRHALKQNKFLAPTTKEPEGDSTAAENLCIPSSGPSQVEAGSSTSLIIASTSAADNPLPLSVAQSRDTATAIPTTPTSSKLILQDMNINVPVSVLSPVPIGTYVAGQGKRKPRKKPTILVLTSTPNIEEAKAKSAPPPVPKKNTRKVTKALDFSSDSENDFSSIQGFTEVGDDDEDCPCIYCNDLYSRSKPKEVWLMCLSCKRWAHASCADVPKNTKRFTCELCL
ncbi:hypothetical protein HW555_012402 [Spodoptera exigua]|uniref:Zinc finger PHD-type domain-containing protein n=1 Tax=Spodoptera exigua TaxID=7107 RepID=A0A835G527_SPOEX|nr:hypothetical protein HW555_012402 [Spodoptera exigua]